MISKSLQKINFTKDNRHISHDQLQFTGYHMSNVRLFGFHMNKNGRQETYPKTGEYPRILLYIRSIMFGFSLSSRMHPSTFPIKDSNRKTMKDSYQTRLFRFILMKGFEMGRKESC